MARRRRQINRYLISLWAVLIESARWVDDGNVVTSSGVSAGIDMSLAIIARLFDVETAEAIANAAEYTWHREASVDPFAHSLNQVALPT